MTIELDYYDKSTSSIMDLALGQMTQVDIKGGKTNGTARHQRREANDRGTHQRRENNLG